jgi:flagellar biosynthesis chaperone FliJ
MQPFRFRAAGALDLWRKQEDEARSVLARAEAAERAAAARVDGAEEAVQIEGARLDVLQREGATAWLMSWHRSWIAKQRLDVQTCRRDREAATQVTTQAAVVLRLAYRRRRTLERLRDRTLRKYDLEVKRQDTIAMNELAGLRYVARAAESKGESSEHRQHDSRGRSGGNPAR